jgi:hypothetical protein
MSLWSNLWIGCKQATFLHEKMVEDKLALSESIGLRIHLTYCRFCRQFVKQTKALAQWVHTMQSIPYPQRNLPAEKKAHLQEMLNQSLKNK